MRHAAAKTPEWCAYRNTECADGPSDHERPQLKPAVDPLQFATLVDAGLHHCSGKVFYSGRSAFSTPSRLYVLGLNPGGSAVAQAANTIKRNLSEWRDRPPRWSAYCDESWQRKPPGTYGMAPRVLHLFERLGLDPRDVPASNVVFVRSNNEAALAAEKAALLAKCWPVHEAVISTLGIDTVACFGATAGRWVRSLFGANVLAGRLIERNARGWANEAHLNARGTCVLTLTHPSHADWRNPAADPTALVTEMLDR